MMCINAAFTLYATNQLPEIPIQRCIGVGIKTGEAAFGGEHLSEVLGGKSQPGSRQSTASGRLRLKSLSEGMLHADEMMSKHDVRGEPGHKSVTESQSPALPFNDIPRTNLGYPVAKE